jgi:flagellar basal-body rod protein FlgB
MIAMLNALDQFFAPGMQALDLRARRGEVLASNIANADTPGYKARDFDFATALRGAMSAAPSGGGLTLSRTSQRHLQSSAAPAGAPALSYRIPVQASIDGNTVEMDTELGHFSDNALRYQADLTFMTDKLKLLQSALST